MLLTSGKRNVLWNSNPIRKLQQILKFANSTKATVFSMCGSGFSIFLFKILIDLVLFFFERKETESTATDFIRKMDEC